MRDYYNQKGEPGAVQPWYKKKGVLFQLNLLTGEIESKGVWNDYKRLKAEEEPKGSFYYFGFEPQYYWKDSLKFNKEHIGWRLELDFSDWIIIVPDEFKDQVITQQLVLSL